MSPRDDAQAAPREHKAHAPRHLRFALLTISDSRQGETDRSGEELLALARGAEHEVVARALVRDEPTQVRAWLDETLARDDVDVLVTTGGTGVAPRDVTIETLAPLLEKELPGFGELFRRLSYEEIGTAAMATRATAGTARGKLVFLLPGSPGACRLAMARLVLPEAPHLVALLRR